MDLVKIFRDRLELKTKELLSQADASSVAKEARADLDRLIESGKRFWKAFESENNLEMALEMARISKNYHRLQNRILENAIPNKNNGVQNR